jgi:hypothetical protein
MRPQLGTCWLVHEQCARSSPRATLVDQRNAQELRVISFGSPFSVSTGVGSVSQRFSKVSLKPRPGPGFGSGVFFLGRLPRARCTFARSQEAGELRSPLVKRQIIKPCKECGFSCWLQSNPHGCCLPNCGHHHWVNTVHQIDPAILHFFHEASPCQTDLSIINKQRFRAKLHNVFGVLTRIENNVQRYRPRAGQVIMNLLIPFQVSRSPFR